MLSWKVDECTPLAKGKATLAAFLAVLESHFAANTYLVGRCRLTL
jgi:hypothetical protein